MVRFKYDGAHGEDMEKTVSIGKDLCLDFAGTVDWRTSGHPQETLANYPDLVSWSVRKGVLGEREAERMLQTVDRDEVGSDVMKEARVLREVIYRLFSASAHGRRADAADLGVLNGYLARALAKREVQMTDEGFVWGWCSGESPDRMLYPVAQSAAELLTSPDLARVRECANDEQGCGSLFIDSSKSQTRKWCSMKSCGNRVKFRTYYERHSRPRPSETARVAARS